MFNLEYVVKDLGIMSCVSDAHSFVLNSSSSEFLDERTADRFFVLLEICFMFLIISPNCISSSQVSPHLIPPISSAKDDYGHKGFSPKGS